MFVYLNFLSQSKGSKAHEMPGPFELTKLSAQIAVLMAKREMNQPAAVDERLRRQYEQLGTIRTAQLIVKTRGLKGLYSGFHLHLRE
jgi:solute carrier family 25 (mitochondrial carnitine/acylcarnitine transporter), member 20/29